MTLFEKDQNNLTDNHDDHLKIQMKGLRCS